MEETTNNKALKREEVIKQATELRQKIENYNNQLYTLLDSSDLKESTQLIDFNFYLSNKAGHQVKSVFCQNKKFIYTNYKTLLCNVPVTFKKIFNEAKIHLDKYIEKYKDYKIQRKPITNSTFRIIIKYTTNPNYVDQIRRLYEIDIDNANNNKLTYEYKNNFLIEESKDNLCSFNVNIEIELYNNNKFFQYDGEKDPIIEDVCIICHKNKPNVLITKCFHLVACYDCFHFNRLSSCPRCHKTVTSSNHVVHFLRSTKY